MVIDLAGEQGGEVARLLRQICILVDDLDGRDAVRDLCPELVDERVVELLERVVDQGGIILREQAEDAGCVRICPV